MKLVDLPFKNYIYPSLALNVVTGVFIILFQGFLPPIVPLFYGRAVSESRLIPALGLLIAPSVSLLINVVNVFLSIQIDDRFLKKVLVSGGLLTSILTTITVVKIALLVGFFK